MYINTELTELWLYFEKFDGKTILDIDRELHKYRPNYPLYTVMDTKQIIDVILSTIDYLIEHGLMHCDFSHTNMLINLSPFEARIIDLDLCSV